MNRATPVLLFLGSNCASIYAWLAIRKLAFLSLTGTVGVPNDPCLYKEYWTHGLIGLLFAVPLTVAFVLAARGRSRFAAGLPLTICAWVVLGLVVQNPHAFAWRCP